jgi:hypothetical protein
MHGMERPKAAWLIENTAGSERAGLTPHGSNGGPDA